MVFPRNSAAYFPIYFKYRLTTIPILGAVMLAMPLAAEFLVKLTVKLPLSIWPS